MQLGVQDRDSVCPQNLKEGRHGGRNICSDSGWLEGQVREMAPLAYGHPNKISKTVGRNVVTQLLISPSGKLEKEEGPIRPRPSVGGRTDC